MLLSTTEPKIWPSLISLINNQLIYKQISLSHYQMGFLFHTVEKESICYLKLVLEKVKLLVEVIDGLIVCFHRGRLFCNANLKTEPVHRQTQRYFYEFLTNQTIGLNSNHKSEKQDKRILEIRWKLWTTDRSYRNFRCLFMADRRVKWIFEN